MKKVGYLWNNKDIEIVEVGGKMYALDGWNGEVYNHCWRISNEKGFDRAGEKKIEYILTPILQGVGEADEDGNYDDYEIVDYDVVYA